MTTAKEVLLKLPGSWSQVRLSQYLELNDMNLNQQEELDGVFSNVNTTYQMIHILSGVPVQDLEELTVGEMNVVGSKLAFMQTPPDPQKKSTIRWKKLDQVTYNDYVTMLQLQKEPVKNMVTIIKAFSQEELSDQQIKDMSVEDAMTGFFLLRKTVDKFIRRTVRCTTWTLAKQVMKQKVKRLLPFRKRTGESSNNTRKTTDTTSWPKK